MLRFQFRPGAFHRGFEAVALGVQGLCQVFVMQGQNLS